MFSFFSKDDSHNQVKDEVTQLPIAKIVPNKYQPRNIFNDEKILELSESIREHGVIQPIVVRKLKDGYEIIAGERRYRASKLIGLDKVPAIIRDYDDKKSASIAIVENIQREDLTAIEEALAYKQLIDLHGICLLYTSAQSPEVGKVEDEVQVEMISGGELRIACSALFIIDALKAINNSDVIMSFNGDMRPFVLRDKYDETTIQLIVPVRME